MRFRSVQQEDDTHDKLVTVAALGGALMVEIGRIGQGRRGCGAPPPVRATRPVAAAVKREAGTGTANGQKVDLAMPGTRDPQKTGVLITSKGPAPTGGQMEVQMQVTSTHVGPCKS